MSPRRGPEIVWSQDALHKRTFVERVIAQQGPRVLRAVGLAAIGLVSCLVVGIVLAEQALHPLRRDAGAQAGVMARRVAVAHGAALEDIPLIAPDGVLLRAWSLARPGRSRGTVLLLHGLGDTRASQLPLAGLLLDHDYRVLAPDWRAHGASGGPLATYGLLERADLIAWATWIRDRRPDECVFAAGSSMGAAIALQALGTATFCAVVAEAPYATFRGAARLRVGRQFGLPPLAGRVVAAPFVEAAIFYARLRYGLAFGAANPVDAARETRVPILVIEDGADDRVPAGDAARLAAANPRHVTAWTVPGARHVGAWAAAPEDYPRRVLAFLGAHQ